MKLLGGLCLSEKVRFSTSWFCMGVGHSFQLTDCSSYVLVRIFLLLGFGPIQTLSLYTGDGVAIFFFFKDIFWAFSAFISLKE